MDLKELEDMLLTDTQRLDELHTRMEQDKAEMKLIRSRQSLIFDVLNRLKKEAA